jgi:hypothetical protein
MNIGIEFYWDFGILPSEKPCEAHEQSVQVDLGKVFAFSTGVQKVNNKDGIVTLNAADVGADEAGSAAAVQAALAAQIADLSNSKLDAVDYVERFLGVFPSVSVLNLDHPLARPGDSADIDGGSGFDVMRAIWDSSDQKWVVREVNNAQNTDQVSEGNINLYFAGSRVRATPLTGLAPGTNTSILATDELLAALAKLQAQIDAGANAIAWADVTKVPAALAFGFAADNSHPLQVGKDSGGNIYVKGVVRNTGGSSIAAFADIMTVPASHKFKWMPSSSHYLIPSAGGYFHNIASATGINSCTYLTARASATTCWLGISTTLPAGAVLILPEQCIGFVG